MRSVYHTAGRIRRRSAGREQRRLTEGNLEQNLRIVDEVDAVASEVDATSAQVALAWLLAQGDDVAPYSASKRTRQPTTPS
jgi:aryl-alcohol dehydrogenase-like predicted oxidoreductase